MPQIVQVNSSVVAAVVTDRTGYVNARKEADTLAAANHGLTGADMPMLIQAMASYAEVRKAIRPGGIDTLTGEYHGLRDYGRSYEVWHSVGSLATAEGLEKAFKNIGMYGFMPVADTEWADVGKGSYNGLTVARVHLEDARKGNVPAPGTPYTIFARLDKDSPKINGRGQWDYDTFMQDDRALMITGSPESREALAKMLFGKKGEGGEGWSNIGSYHRIYEVGFDAQAKGRLACLGYYDDGLVGNLDINDYGRFVGVGAGGAVRAENASSGIVPPTLEQVLGAVLSASRAYIPELGRPSFERDVREALAPLYQNTL